MLPMTTYLPAEEEKDVIADVVKFVLAASLLMWSWLKLLPRPKKREIFAKNREKLLLCFHSLIDANIFYTNIILLVD